MSQEKKVFIESYFKSRENVNIAKKHFGRDIELNLLIKDFEKGASDHLNSMTAAILLYDYNLSHLIKRHGDKITKDPRLEEYLAAAYNGGPARVSRSYTATILNKINEWFGHLRPETKGFIKKLRFLQENNLP